MPEARYLPFKLLEEGWTYYSVNGGKNVLKLRTVIMKIEVQLNDRGDPLLDQSGKPILNFGAQPVSVLLTEKEYAIEKQVLVLE